MMPEQGGARATKFGKATEAAVESQLVHAGLRRITDKEKRRFRLGISSKEDLGDAWYAKNVKKFKNIYGVGFFADFFVYEKACLPDGLILEVKTQDTPGSVDEKYVFTVLSLIGVPAVESWVVFDGAGARECAIEWMRRQSKAKNRFTFLTFAEFRRHFYDTMRKDD